MIEVFGPERMGNKVSFGVRREWETGLVLKFKITHDPLSNKWFHDSFPGQRDSMCREKLYMPERDCWCIRACKKKMEAK